MGLTTGISDPQLDVHAASFRDPSGSVFVDSEGQLLRQINHRYEAHYRKLVDSGLYDELVGDGLLVAHDEVELSRRYSPEAAVVIQPVPIPFISYPYEWSFSQLKDAARLTLEIQRRALNRGMILKDASAFNVQFVGSQPRFIDTLSLETHREESPWSAYGQFCRHFLAPLTLMANVDIRLSSLLRRFIDGIPLDLTSRLLPLRSRLSVGTLIHLCLHARSIARHSDTKSKNDKSPVPRMSRLSLDGLIDSLTHAIDRLHWSPDGTQWADYYDDHSYTEGALSRKRRTVEHMIETFRPDRVIDLGANTGTFSRIASRHAELTISLDIDPACVERNYRELHPSKDTSVLPLLMDLANPSPGLGWASTERESFRDRSSADLVMALALVHHLAIANNVPLPRIASLLASMGRNVIVEFVPKSDPQVQRLLRGREDVMDDYCQAGFEQAMETELEIVQSIDLKNDGRRLYLLQRRPGGM